LTQSNPTTLGLDFPQDRILACLCPPEALTYAPSPRGLAAGREAIAAYSETGALPSDEPVPLNRDALAGFLAQAQGGDYVSIQAWVRPSAEVDAALQVLRTLIRDSLRLATTVGYGPRFLHSTGQLHKGDAGNGLFIQFSAQPVADIPIPDTAGKVDSGISFGTLILSQALGDQQALLDEGRRVLHFHLSQNPVQDLQTFIPTIMEGP
jgi:hypothetical protein